MARVYFILISISICSVLPAISQDNDENFKSIVEHFDELDERWHSLEPNLDNYEGIQTYCTDNNYKENVHDMLEKLHHYDTLIINKMNDASYEIDNRERSKILKQIEKFEEEYSIPKFLEKLKQECHDRHETEHDKKYTRNDFADNSYDGQRLIVELEIQKYMKHITAKIDHIDKYLNHLHISEIKF